MACVTRKNRKTQSVNFSATNFAWRHQRREGNALPQKPLIGTSVPPQGIAAQELKPQFACTKRTKTHRNAGNNLKIGRYQLGMHIAFFFAENRLPQTGQTPKSGFD